MKYVIMCGGNYSAWETPKQVVKLGGEPLVGRTIRLLNENGIDNIAISSNNAIFEQFGVEVIKHSNNYCNLNNVGSTGDWLDAFCPSEDPICYLFGDVVYSPSAIKTIVKTNVDSIMFFGSAPPFSSDYIKRWAEPLAFKVQDPALFFDCIAKTKQLEKEGKFKRQPIAWELWQVIKGTPLNNINYNNYVVINDYSCDIDELADIQKFEDILDKKATKYAIHACPQRRWYVDQYLVPSLLEQGILEKDILVYTDTEEKGNLVAFLDSCKEIVKKWGTDRGVWHLQDDVILSSSFASRTQGTQPDKIVCAFASKYDERDFTGDGLVKDDMWWSFPCIFIPNKILKEFYEWVDIYVWRDNQFRMIVRSNKQDDMLFKIFVQNYYPNYKVHFEIPNLVNHVDYLLGGSMVNKQRGDNIITSKYWDEDDLVRELRKKLLKN